MEKLLWIEEKDFNICATPSSCNNVSMQYTIVKTVFPDEKIMFDLVFDIVIYQNDENKCAHINFVSSSSLEDVKIIAEEHWESIRDVIPHKVIWNEKILCAAIYYPKIEKTRDTQPFYRPYNIEKGQVTVGYRHGHCFGIIYDISPTQEDAQVWTHSSGQVQGFITNYNNFYNRQVSRIVMKLSGENFHTSGSDMQLYSEDLYQFDIQNIESYYISKK